MSVRDSVWRAAVRSSNGRRRAGADGARSGSMAAAACYRGAMERFAILDHGCKVNRYDGELVRAAIRRFGLVEASATDAPDLYVLNACAVTDRAVRRGRQALRRMRRENPGCRLVVTGCMTGKDRDAYAAIENGMVVVPGNDADALHSALRGLLTEAVVAGVEPGLDAASYDDRTRAFLKVQDGCDAKCSFCVIPSIRGGARSRSRDAILAEARALVERGFRELVVCGIHLGHYGRDSGDSLIGLIPALAALPGEFRLRLGSLEVGEVDASFMRAVRDCERVVPHFHVPLQSGDDRVLRAMRRPYTARRFLERIDVLRAIAPDVALTTDVIVGFPTEDEDAFTRTLDTVRAAGFAKVHAFPYSPRAGTEAAELPGRVALPTLRARVARLLELDATLARAFDERCVGGIADVLIQRPNESGSLGLSERYRRVLVRGRHPRGSFVRAVVSGIDRDSLLAEPVHERV